MEKTSIRRDFARIAHLKYLAQHRREDLEDERFVSIGRNFANPKRFLASRLGHGAAGHRASTLTKGERLGKCQVA